MATSTDLREKIQSALTSCAKGNLAPSARALFNTLGYESDRNASWTLETFIELGANAGKPLTPKDQQELRRLKSLDLIFQVGNQELSLQTEFNSLKVDDQNIQSYIFFSADLPHGTYNRGELTAIARLINKPLPMPAIVLFRHGEKDEPLVSIAIIRRRLNKRDAAKDVLDKATLIKDIRCADPIRAHIEILNDFSLPSLREFDEIPNFVKLHAAWEKKLDSYALSNAFYREIADWYFWAQHQVEDGVIRLPEHCDTEQEKSLFLIRLLTRIIFCWFLVEKRLIPADLFRVHSLKKLIKDFNPSSDPTKPDSSPAYYHAVLQNLFFGTLNMPPEQRGFRERKKEGARWDDNRGVTTLWRHESTFNDPSEWTAISKRVPFLNGGLFDCLDDKIGKKTDNTILDGFSDNPKEACHLPNDLFFGAERNVDLSKDYGEEAKKTARSKKAKVRGLIEILSRYKFTIEENTPLEEEIALDPELLGKVFENLLASYNEDTKTTARKALGAFYTPREIVSYMVDESLKSYLTTQVPKCKGALEDLFSNKATLKEIQPATRTALIDAIGRVKILDPACGSGAFPMGALHRLVDLLKKLDPENQRWREVQRQRALIETEAAFQSGDRETREQRLKEINDTFEFNSSDYGRKLYLIENAIYGVDIQPVAVQIAKLRFFIALVVDQRVCPQEPNLAVRPLPNLETRLVAADTLIPIPRPKLKQASLFGDDAASHKQVEQLKQRLQAVRHEHFNARDPKKKRACKDLDESIRAELSAVLKKTGMDAPIADKLSAWDPYDQNGIAPFFDTEWMFGLPIGKVRTDSPATPVTLRGNLGLINEASGQAELTESAAKEVDSGFDLIISNPPYRKERDSKKLFDKVAATSWGSQYQESKMDYWFYFMHRSIDLARFKGVIVFITSRYWIESSGAKKLINRIANELSPINVVDIGKLHVFDNVAGHHMIHIYQHSRVKGVVLVKRLQNDLSGIASIKTGQNVEVSTRQAVEMFEETGRIKLYASRQTIPSDNTLGDFFRVSQGVVQNPDKVNRKNAEKFGLNQGDGVFVLQSQELASLRLSKAEMQFVKPFYDEARIRRFYALPATSHLLYLTRRNCESLESFPNLYTHLSKFRSIMEERRETVNGSNQWFHLHWPRDESLFEDPHLVLPSMFVEPSAAVFTSSAYVGIGSNVVVANDSRADLWILACLLNSKLADFWWKENGKQRGAGVDVGVDRLRGFPLPQTIPQTGESVIMRALASMIAVSKIHLDSGLGREVTRDPLMLAYWERVLNGLVYELYFPEEVHGAGLRLFNLVEKAKLPDVDALAEKDRLPRLRQKFEELHDGGHPLRIALDKLQTLDTVRIIEGKA